MAERLGGDDLRREIRKLLVSGEEPIGDPGRSRGVRVAQGGLQAAEELMDKLEALGGGPAQKGDYPDNYRGRVVLLGEEGWVGLRRGSKSKEPTLDVIQVKCVTEMRKVKFE